MSSLALSDSFEYLCYGSKAIRNISTLTARGSTTKVDPRAVRVTLAILIMTIFGFILFY